MTLWDLKPKKKGFIQSIDKKIDSRFLNRLRDIGFEIREEIQCLKTTPLNGPKIFQIGDGVFSLEKEIAQNIIIQAIG